MLVADDLTGASQPVRNFASGLAEALDVPIDLIHVDDSDSESETRNRTLQETARSMRGRVRPLFVRGSPVGRVISKVSRQPGHGLIAMGTRSRSGLSRAVFGSVAEDLLRHSSVPVLTIGEKSDVSVRDVLEAPRLLIATDLGPNSRRAEAYGVLLAARLGAKVILIHSMKEDIHPVLEVAMTTETGSRELSLMTDELRAGALKKLVFREKQFTKRGISCFSVLDDTSPSAAQAIENEIRRSHASIVVVGTHGRTRAQELFFGRTARSVVANSPVPVITVRSRG